MIRARRWTSAFIVPALVIAGVGVSACSASAAELKTANAAVPSATSALPACDSSDPADCGQLFDDFSYTSASDNTLSAHGWSVRSGGGGPGVSGAAVWTPNNVSFPTNDGSKALHLVMSTNGKASGTTEAEVARTNEDSFAGTYAARIKFSDTPVSGATGDHLVEAYFAISTTPECDPTYSELDFSEYLPNGGYGNPNRFNSQTSWQTTGAACPNKFTETDETKSYNGWHTVMSTVSNGHVIYYIDGTKVADHSGNYYPRRNMSIDFNLWLLDLTGHSGAGTSTWAEDVDYTYYAENRTMTPAQVTAQINAYRSAGTTFTDNVGRS